VKTTDIRRIDSTVWCCVVPVHVEIVCMCFGALKLLMSVVWTQPV